MRNLFIILFLLQFIIINSQVYKVNSPENIIQVEFILEEGKAYYSVQRFGKDVIGKSILGYELENNVSLKDNFVIEAVNESSLDETWEQVWGEKRFIRNNYNELKIDLSQSIDNPKKISIVFRVYDDGVGFRYEFPEQNNLEKFNIIDEITEFKFTGNHTSWWIPAYHWNRYEYLYEETPLSKIDTVHTPVTFETKNGLFISIHEAALTDFSSMTLEPVGDFTLKTNLVPWSDGIKVKTKTPIKSPWRTIQIADNAGGLIESYLILNLNEPNKLEDVSWIKPGKYVGIWWGMHLGIETWGSGEKHGATTENTKRYLDFASKYGFDGVLVEGWNKGWDGDWIANGDIFNFTEPYDDFDIDEVIRYGNEKGVRLIGHHETGGGIINYEKQMDDAYKFYEKYGVRAVKSGYVNHGNGIKRLDENGNVVKGEWHHGQFMVEFYRKALTEAAKHKIMINAHEPIKATGIRRTYPNMLTREGARGQEFNAWGENQGNPPEHTTILPFTRLLGGPMDFTPGIFDLLFEEEKPDNRVNTTLMKQLALYVVLYSPLHMAADLPENYEARLDVFQFIVDVPTDWEDTKVLNAEIGDYITIVRRDRNSEDWFLGSITDEEGRNLKISLNFLDKNRTYKAQIYRDGNNADWKTNPYDYVIEEKEVKFGNEMTLRLAPSGGTAIKFIAQ